MIRLLAALGIFLFAALWFLGADHGQYINPPKPAAVAAAAPAKRQIFIPARPVPGALPAEPQPVPNVEPEAGTDPAADMASLPPEPGSVPLPDAPSLLATPELDQPTLIVKPMRAPGGATVHTGPGIAFPVLGMLKPGGVVMVAEASATQGWVRIMVDGGGEGWVAAALMKE